MNQEATLALWKMCIVILLQKHNGLVRITEAELRAYNSDEWAIACQVVPDEQSMDMVLLTKEEADAFNN